MTKRSALPFSLSLSSITIAALAAASLPALAAEVPVSAVPATVADGGACQPAWPSSSLQKKESGTVDMQVLVLPDGRASEVKIARSSGYRNLDKTSVATVAKCRFVPAQADGKPVLSWFPLRHEWIPGRGTVPPSADFNSCAKPQWPKESLRKEQTGAVTLAFLIDTDGKVSDSRIEQSSGFPLLDMAAQEGIEKCTFTPGLENGEPAKSWMMMKYVWTLDTPNPAQMAQALAAARAGAAGGDVESLYKLGLIYLNGHGVEKDPVEARKWIQQAAERGWIKAQETMGILSMRNSNDASDSEEAAGWFRKAAAQNSAMGQYMLGGLLLRQGKSEEAMPWLRLAAQQGQSGGQTLLAGLLIKGGKEDELPEAIDLLNQAVAQNDAMAQVGMGHLYQAGRGVAQDYAQAAALYKRAAVNGNAEGQLALARLYELGKGVPQDTVKAQELRRLAYKIPAPPAK